MILLYLALLVGGLLVFLMALLGYEVYRALQIAINEYFDSFFKDLDDDDNDHSDNGNNDNDRSSGEAGETSQK